MSYLRVFTQDQRDTAVYLRVTRSVVGDGVAGGSLVRVVT